MYCAACKKLISHRNSLRCVICKKFYHYQCLNRTPRNTWYCSTCKTNTNLIKVPLTLQRRSVNMTGEQVQHERSVPSNSDNCTLTNGNRTRTAQILITLTITLKEYGKPFNTRRKYTILIIININFINNPTITNNNI